MHCLTTFQLVMLVIGTALFGMYLGFILARGVMQMKKEKPIANPDQEPPATSKARSGR